MADKDYYEYLNTIDTLNEQIMAILDIMRGADGNTDMQSINTVADMCMTLQLELMAEVDKIEEYAKDYYELGHKTCEKIVAEYEKVIKSDIFNNATK